MSDAAYPLEPIERLRSLAFGVINQAAQGALANEDKQIKCSWAALASWAKEIEECTDLLRAES